MSWKCKFFKLDWFLVVPSYCTLLSKFGSMLYNRYSFASYFFVTKSKFWRSIHVNSWKTLSIIRSHIHVIFWGLHFVGQFLFKGWGRGSAWYWWREYCKRDSHQILVLLRLQWLTVSELNPPSPPSQKTLFLMVELIIFQLENKLLVKLLVMHDMCL